MSQSTLPFSFADIKEISWIPGEDSCAVVYADADGTACEMQVQVTAMDTIRPSFKRMLVCTAACGLSGEGYSLVSILKGWNTMLRGRSAQDFMLGSATLLEWSELDTVVLPTPGAPYRVNQDAFILGWTNGAGAAFSPAVMEANIPGVVAACAILRENYSVPALDALRLLVNLSRGLPYSILADQADAVADTLRSCILLDATASEMGQVLTARIGVSSGPESLPELSQGPTV
jgi:hypothetical protein